MASVLRSFGDEIHRWRSIIKAPAASPGELNSNMQALYKAIYDAEFAKLDPLEVKATAEVATAALFDLYLTLRDRIPEWKALGLFDQQSAEHVRNAMRVVRYTIDIIGEVAGGYQQLHPGEEPHKVFDGPPHLTLLHPALAEGARVTLEAGDVILMRGRLNNSAAIARIGDVDSQFSHAGIVHIDPDGTRWLVEALIEDGSVMTPIDEALAHGTGRALLLRHRDRALAAKAGEMAARRVRAGTRGLFGWIPYDFSMEPVGDDQFFCSKLVGYAFRAASGGKTMLPSHATRLGMTNRDFFERLGVTAFDTFAPGDLEIEPEFAVVAEWRDFRVTPGLRMQDLIMSALFDWMDRHDYRFKEGASIAVAALFGRMSSYLPAGVKRLLARVFGLPRIPRNMNVRMISTIGMLHKTAEPLLEQLMGLEEASIAATGRPLHPRDIQRELGRIQDISGGRIGYLVAG